MGKAKKATIKFQKNHLKGAIEQRRKKQKAVQLYKKRNPKKFGKGAAAAAGANANGKDDSDSDGREDEEDDEKKNESADENEKLKDMGVDEFFNNELDDSDDEPEESDNEDFDGIDTIIEEDDGSDMETPTPKKNKTAAEKAKQAQKEAAAQKITLDALKEKDPEFYKYLQENDQSLLDFEGEMEDLESEEEQEDDDEEMGEGSDAEMEDVEEEEEKPKKKKKAEKGEFEDVETMDGIPVVTKDMVAAWQEALVEKHSLRALRRILLAFRAGAHLHDSEDDRTYAYKINSPIVFNKLVVTVFKYTIPTFDYHLPTQKTAGGKVKPVNSGSKYTTLQPLIKSFLQNTIFLLKQLTDQDMIYFVVRESEKAIRYLAGFPKIAKDLLKHLLFLWSTGSDRVRIISFLTVRTMALQLGPAYLDMSLKGAYLTFVRYAKSTTIHTLPNIHLMQNCIAQLYGLDHERAYQHGFVYIRQLAIHLRNAVMVKTKESFKAVYNWQYLHCLSLWSQVIATHAVNQKSGQTTPLHPLIFPLVQVSLGALRLIPTSTYYPLRFQIIRNLIQVIENTGTFIPLAPYLFEVLEGGEMKRPGRKGTLKPLEWDLTYKSGKEFKGTRVYQDGTGEQVFELMIEYFALFSTSISFPELVIPAIVQLKRFNKKSNLTKLTKQFQGLIDKLEQNARFIEQERNKADFAPSDATAVAGFLKHQDKEKTPLGAYWKGIKRSILARRKMVEEARKDRAAKSNGDEDDDDEEGSSRRKRRGGDDEDEMELEDDDESMDEDDLEEVEDDYDSE